MSCFCAKTSRSGRRRFQPREPAQIDRALGLADPDQNAAVARSERVDVPRPDEVVGAEVRVDGHADGAGPLLGRDAGREAVARVPVDGDGERRAAHGGVDRGLIVELQPVAVALGQRDAEVAHGVLEHEGDGFGRDELRRHDQIALVLAVLIVGEDHHLPIAQVLENLGDWRERLGNIGLTRFGHGDMVEGCDRRGARNGPA